jgi:hypothetical protein
MVHISFFWVNHDAQGAFANDVVIDDFVVSTDILATQPDDFIDATEGGLWPPTITVPTLGAGSGSSAGGILIPLIKPLGTQRLLNYKR